MSLISLYTADLYLYTKKEKKALIQNQKLAPCFNISILSPAQKFCQQTILTQVNLHLEYNKLYVGNKVYEDDAIADGFYDSIAALKQTTPNNLIFQLSSING